MATNADFDALIVRIDAATTTLENSVDAVANGSADVEAAVIEAQQAATTSQQQATLATNSATIASNSATTATQQAQAATDLVTQLEASVVLEEAPQDGQQYARQDGAWTVVEATGGGSVTSVNSIAPDVNGNVTLSATDVGAKPSSYIPTWSEVTGKPTVFPTNWANVADKPTTFTPTIGTTADTALAGNTVIPTNTSDLTNDSGFITEAAIPTNVSQLTNDAGYITAAQVPTSGLEEAPNDGQQYARQNEAWSPVQSPTAPLVGVEVGALGFRSTPAMLTAWATAGAWFAQPLSELRGVSPSARSGWDPYFSDPVNLAKMPAGLYYFRGTDFKGAGNPLTGRQGFIAVINYSSTKNIVNGVQVNKPPTANLGIKGAISFSWSGNSTTQSAAIHILSLNANSYSVMSWVAA